jgi:hypothetical protein
MALQRKETRKIKDIKVNTFPTWKQLQNTAAVFALMSAFISVSYLVKALSING